jgi:hypothetical protein
VEIDKFVATVKSENSSVDDKASNDAGSVKTSSPSPSGRRKAA